MKFFRKASEPEKMPELKLFSWQGRHVLLVNWESLVVTEGPGKTIAGMDLRRWYRVLRYLKT